MRLPLSCQALIDSAWIEHKSLLPEEGVHMFVAHGATKAVFVREGASKYKTWLTKKYKESGRSIDAIIALLNNYVPSREAGLKNDNQESGADMFRKALLRDYKANGADRLAKHLTR